MEHHCITTLFFKKVLNIVFKEAQEENGHLCLFNSRFYELT